MLIEHANNSAESKFSPIKQKALAEMASHLDEEIVRLQSLAKVNSSVRKAEIDFMIDRKNHSF